MKRYEVLRLLNPKGEIRISERLLNREPREIRERGTRGENAETSVTLEPLGGQNQTLNRRSQRERSNTKIPFWRQTPGASQAGALWVSPPLIRPPVSASAFAGLRRDKTLRRGESAAFSPLRGEGECRILAIGSRCMGFMD